MKRFLPTILVVLVFAACGCGIKTGYAPERINVHQGAAQVAYAPASLDSILVVSWNIQYGENVELALQEKKDFPPLAEADIILVQEMDPDGVRMMADSLGFNHVYGTAAVHPHHKKQFGNGVLSRWPIMNHRVLILPHETMLTGHRRIAVAADIDLGGRQLRAVSIHTATMVMDQDKRFEQAEAVRDSLGSFDGPVLIAGDFNTVSEYEGTLLRRTMRGLGMKTVRLPEGPTIANKYKKIPGSVPVLDHIFFKDMTAGASGIADETTASDHYPIWTVLHLPPLPGPVDD
jgi:endonuclease/exonuclease/phosphatase family metal-dependent hydrolase